MNTIQPNYAVKALVPIPSPESVQKDSFFRKMDGYISAAYKSRRKIYRFLILSIFFFSALGIYYYNYDSSGLTPLTSYVPFAEHADNSFLAVLSFRKFQIAISFLIYLCGFTIFGPAVSSLSVFADAFLVGFTLKYSIEYLSARAFTKEMILYMLLIALFLITDAFIACEVIKYSKNARSGIKELFKPKRFWIYTASYVLITGFSLIVTYCFLTFIN